jgi:hypothetical protein
MTDLLSSPSSRRAARAGTGDGETVRRPLALGAALAGAAAPGTALLLLWAVGLVGWFAADGGSHGSTRTVLRIAADGWLLAHGASLSLDAAVVTASPLGLTLACGYLTYRFGRWAGATSAVDDLRTAGTGTVVLAGVYAVASLLVAVLASEPGAEPGFVAAFLGGAVVGGVAGGAGLVRGAGLATALRRTVPLPALAVGYGAVAVCVAMAASGASLVAVALGVRGAAAGNVVEQLRLDVTGAALSVLLLLALAPNVVLLAVGYLLGPGFALGAGTVVSPQEVALGPLPSVPVLAALPPDGWSPGWAVAVLGVPVVAAAAGGFLAGRMLPTSSYQSGGARGLGAGAVAALVLAAAAGQAGGSIGPGRMAATGVDVTDVFLAALLAFGPAAALGGLLATWWARRRGLADAVHEPEDPSPGAARGEPLAPEDEVTVRLDLPGRSTPPAG